MKFARFFGLFLALFTLVLLFSGCDVLPFGNDDNNNNNNNNKPPTSNGSVYYAKTPDSKCVIISIYSPGTTGKAITFKDGDKYALAIAPIGSNGIEFTGKADSVGTISVDADGKFTFKPETSGQQNFNGSLSGKKLTLDKVPGASYTNLGMEWLTDGAMTTNQPFPSFTIPDDPGDNNNNNNNNVPSIVGGTYEPGKIVKKIDIIQEPNWEAAGTKAKKKKYYEGDPIDAASLTGTGMQVKITYSDNTTKPFKEGEIAQNFVIEPFDFRPKYTTDDSQYKLYYNKGPITEESVTASFKGPDDSSETHQLYTLKNVILPEISKGLAEWYEDEKAFYRGSAVKVNVMYEPEDDDRNPKESATSTNRKPYSAPLSIRNEANINNDKTKLTVSFGKDKSVEFTVSTFYKVVSIAINTKPIFAQQVLFDDPRLVLDTNKTNQNTVDAHWLNKLEGGSITVIYENGQPKTRTILEAYNNNAKDTANESFILAPSKTFNSSKGDIGFTYYDQKAALEVPVFNTLTQIYVTGSPDTVPIMHNSIEDDHEQFMRKILVYADYESGKDGVKVRRMNAWAESNEPNQSGPTGKDVGNKKGSFSSSIKESDDDGKGFLTSVTNSYANKGKLTKVTVTFTTGGISKSATIEIGAVGYQQ